MKQARSQIPLIPLIERHEAAGERANLVRFFAFSPARLISAAAIKRRARRNSA